jgi:serine/threonine-protein kinase
MAESPDDNQESTIEQAVQQFVDAQLRGEEPKIDEFVRKYPGLENQIRENIRDLQKIDGLFDTILQAGTSDFDDAAAGDDLIGRKVGSFEIEKVIGRGGMGVVYLAGDTKLDRPVAVKSMPPELQSDPAARMRFGREAKLLASLNHPNIAIIHDIIEQGDGTGYLILEYIEGETLAERIARKPLRLEQALSFGRQIAEAVSAAHENGVVHRDLKPGNIKITPDGRAKVLDFGLAKASASQGKPVDATVTQPGRIMGTPAYMSPEQARGQPADHRTDVWSFGCIMYEMLTGHVPFEGETATDTLARIIEREPDWGTLPQGTPTNMRVLLRRCLEKDPQRRLRDIGDAGIEISETLIPPAVEPPAASPPTEGPRKWDWRRLTAVTAPCVVMGIAIVCMTILKSNHPTPAPDLPMRTSVITPETKLAPEAMWHHALAISPDGKRIAYVEEGVDRRKRIYLREIDEFKARPLPGTEGALSPFFSPDGEWIGYADHFQRKLKKVSVKGGQPVVLTECLQFRGGTWANDDTIVFTPVVPGGLWRISASGEGLRQLTTPDQNNNEYGHVWPQVLPGTKAVLFTNGGKVEAYSLETRERSVLFEGGSYARYVPTGHLLYAHRDSLFAVRFDLQKPKVVGPRVPVLSDVAHSQSGSSQYAVARDGSLAYVPAVLQGTELKPVWVDKEGQVQPLAITPRNYHAVRISPDGKRVVFDVKDGDSWDIWTYDLAHETLSPLTSDGHSSNPVWISDKRVAFVSFGSSSTLVLQDVDGGTRPEHIEFEKQLGFPTCCSPDGKALLVTAKDAERLKLDFDIWMVSLQDSVNDRSWPFIRRNSNQRQSVWSPNGRWVAYASDESGSSEVYVEPYPGPGPKTTISKQGGHQPVWSRDGNELYYRSGARVVALRIETEPDFKVLSSKDLPEGNYVDCILCRTYDVASDGRFLMIHDPQEPTPLRINVIFNWFEELKRLVPVQNE